jgi:predicted CopG family antitoxin
VTKTISLSDEAYEALAQAKRPGESFSEVARRLARLAAKETLFDPRLRVELTEDEAAAWKRAVREERDRSMTPRVDL